MSFKQDALQNVILRQMDHLDFDLIAPHLEAVELDLRQHLVQPKTKITHIWFLESAVASIIAMSASGRQAEVGLVGREGMVDIAPINGVDTSPLEVFAQIPGRAYRLPVAALAAAMAASASLRPLLQRYAQAFFVQVSNTALINISHTLEQRLARWLLMTHDRLDGDDILMTHQFLSLMLGVRRAGVTMSVHKLESSGVVRARRGRIAVTDRAGLEKIAGDAYGLSEAEYIRLIGTDFRRRSSKPNGSGRYTSIARRV